MRNVAVMLALAALVIGWHGTAKASKGFYIGTGMGVASPYHTGDPDDVDPEAAFNWELIHLGYNFTDMFGLSLQWGAAAGPADDILGDDTTWGTGYICLSGRFTYPLGGAEPYLEAGFGTYNYSLMGDDGEFWADPAAGYRIAIGANAYLGNFYIAPELAYHGVEFDEGEFDLDYVHPVYGKEFDVDFEGKGDFLVFQIKIGYHFRRD